MKEVTDRLESGIRDVFESGKYETYLKTMSRFHSYSMSNTMLIYMQKPDATHVAGYHSWQQKFNRCVMKGQKGIQILAPAPYQKTVTMLSRQRMYLTCLEYLRTMPEGYFKKLIFLRLWFVPGDAF